MNNLNEFRQIFTLIDLIVQSFIYLYLLSIFLVRILRTLLVEPKIKSIDIDDTVQ